MHIAYAAHTAACTFLLDAQGVCRWVLAKPGAPSGMLASAQRCVGAQYVASLDLAVEGGLVQLPRVGSSMLFARSEDGRVVLVRTAPLTAFETHPGDAEAPPRRFHHVVEPLDDGTEDDPTVRRDLRDLSRVPPPRIPPPPKSHTRDRAIGSSAPTLPRDRSVIPKRRAR